MRMMTLEHNQETPAQGDDAVPTRLEHQDADALVRADDSRPEEVQPAEDLALSTEVVLHPFNSAAQALWLCQQLRIRLGAEIVYVSRFPQGTVVRLTVPKDVPLLTVLLAMEEVAEAWEEPLSSATHAGRGSLPGGALKGARAATQVVYVALKAPPLGGPSASNLKAGTLRGAST